MAAVVLESVAVLRPSSAVHAAAPSPRMAVATSARRSLPDCKGLRVSRLPVRVSSSSSVTARKAFRRGVVCEAPNTAVDIPDVTTQTWQTLVLESPIPVLVDFWAPWCGPCRMILPCIGELSKEYAGKLKCLKLNTDESPEIANQLGIRSIPTIMIFINGEKKDTVIGAVPKSTLVACVEKFLP